jgi:hypothetical protein
MRHDLEDWAEAVATLDYPAERVSAFSPKSLSVLEIRSEQDLEVLTKIYANSVLLGDESPDGWGIKYGTEFHMTNDSKLFIGRDKAEASGFEPDAYGRWVNAAGEVLLPLYEGRMVGQFDFSKKGWVSGKGRSAVWRDVPWSNKRLEPQFVMPARHAPPLNVVKLVTMEVASATNARTGFAAIIPPYPAGHKTPVQIARTCELTTAYCGVFNSFAFDSALRMALGSVSITWHVLETLPLPRSTDPGLSSVAFLSIRLAAVHPSQIRAWQANPYRPASTAWHQLWAITSHERLRLRCMVDAILGALYGLSRDDYSWLLRDCDHAPEMISNSAFCKQLDPKGFWRIDKDQDPELRHTVLSLAAFDDLQRAIAAAGSRDAGIEAWCSQNDGDGWMLPEALCIADLGMTRTVALDYDERAKTPQPVRSRMGDRCLDWQLAQRPEESWAECQRHAEAIMQSMPQPAAAEPAARPSQPRPQSKTSQSQAMLFGTEH